MRFVCNRCKREYSEEAIGQAVRELGKMGFYAEPTSGLCGTP